MGLFHRKQTLISLRYLLCQQELPCGVRRVEYWINVICILMLKYVGRCLDSSFSKQEGKKKKKVAESSSGIKTRPSVSEVLVRMGLH